MMMMMMMKYTPKLVHSFICPYLIISFFFPSRRSNKPADATAKKEMPNGLTTWDFNDLGERVSCTCSRYVSGAHKLFAVNMRQAGSKGGGIKEYNIKGGTKAVSLPRTCLKVSATPEGVL